jgi:hypothetical protein
LGKKINNINVALKVIKPDWFNHLIYVVNSFFIVNLIDLILSNTYLACNKESQASKLILSGRSLKSNLTRSRP